MNSRGECHRPARKDDLIAESLAREVQELREREEAHLAALRILRTRVAAVEELCHVREQSDLMFAYLDIDEVRAALRGEESP